MHVYVEAKNESSKGRKYLVVTGHLSKSHRFDQLNGRPVPLHPEDFDESEKRAEEKRSIAFSARITNPRYSTVSICDEAAIDRQRAGEAEDGSCSQGEERCQDCVADF